jgi:hypothetical protein
MAVFSLEALDAKSGDALLVHYGTAADPGLMIIDGGFTTTYDGRLKPRLDDLRRARGLAAEDPLPVDRVVVSHLDSDHIVGILAMFRELREAANIGGALPYTVAGLWHNSFQDALLAITASATLPDPVVRAAESAGAVAASVNEARELRDIAEMFSLDGNSPFDGLVMSPRQVKLGRGLSATVIGPTKKRLDALRTEWEKKIKKPRRTNDTARVAAFVDESVPNLSSIAMLLRSGRRRMLLTGDARGDDVLAGLAEARLIDAKGRCKVNVLKIPHHGSVHNVAPEFFDTIVANHYVISADGRHGNPEPETLEMLTSSQGDRAYTVHLTNEAGADVLLAEKSRNRRKYTVQVRASGSPSVRVDLADPAR